LAKSRQGFEKLRQNNSLQFTAQYALKKALFYCTSVTNYHSQAALFLGSHLKKIKILSDEEIQ